MISPIETPRECLDVAVVVAVVGVAEDLPS